MEFYALAQHGSITLPRIKVCIIKLLRIESTKIVAFLQVLIVSLLQDLSLRGRLKNVVQKGQQHISDTNTRVYRRCLLR